jgi:hypothetical protein
MDKLRKIFVAAMICLVVSTTYALAIFLTSNTVTRQVTVSGIVLEVTPSPSISLGATFTLIATLTPTVSGINISFYWNGTHLINSAYTDASGTASIPFIPSSLGSYDFTATCTYP